MNVTWRMLDDDQKREAVFNAVVKCRSERGWTHADTVARVVGIGEATVTRYMRDLVERGALNAEPPLHFRSTGAAKRMFSVGRRRP